MQKNLKLNYLIWNQLSQIGETSTESKVNTRTEPQGSTQYDTEGLDQSEIDAAVAEEKEFIQTQNGNYKDSKIINETDNTGESALEIF